MNTAFVIMGVCGVGKTSTSRTLADRLSAIYVEADDYHPPENRDAMSAGVPLTDEMRLPWLQSLGRAVEEARASSNVVVACSALKRSYRDQLRKQIGQTKFVFLHGDQGLIAERLLARNNHFMASSLLDSQISTLEPPVADEDAIFVDISGTKEQVNDCVEKAVRAVLARTHN